VSEGVGEEEGLRVAELLPDTVALTEAVALPVPVLLRVAGWVLEALGVPVLLTVPLAVLLTVGEAVAEKLPEGA
jgi:hypothetical protein